jgi:tetratricopeptide (TPR) repeat protein
LLYEGARVFEVELNDDEAAIICLQAAYQANPECRPAIRMARRVFARVERWSMVCTFVEAQVRTASSDAERARGLLELGEIYQSRFGRSEEALRCVKKALEFEPGNPFALFLQDCLLALSLGKGVIESSVEGGGYDDGRRRDAHLVQNWTELLVLGRGDPSMDDWPHRRIAGMAGRFSFSFCCVCTVLLATGKGFTPWPMCTPN